MFEPASVPARPIAPVPGDLAARPHAASVCDNDARPAPRAVPPRPGDRLLEGLLWGMVAYERTRQRQQLRVLCEDPDRLRDLGLSRQGALEEASRPFWQR